MRVFQRIAALGAIAALLSGCAGSFERDDILNDLNTAPMPAQTWAHVAGVYMGSIHESTERWGLEDLASTQVRLDLSGSTESPGVLVTLERNYSTAWTSYGEWHGKFTNIPEKRYGTQGSVAASTHAPNQMLVVLHRNSASPYGGTWIILTFIPDGKIQVDWIGHAGWRGQGELLRVPARFSPQ